MLSHPESTAQFSQVICPWCSVSSASRKSLLLFSRPNSPNHVGHARFEWRRANLRAKWRLTQFNFKESLRSQPGNWLVCGFVGDAKARDVILVTENVAKQIADHSRGVEHVLQTQNSMCFWALSISNSLDGQINGSDSDDLDWARGKVVYHKGLERRVVLGKPGAVFCNTKKSSVGVDEDLENVRRPTERSSYLRIPRWDTAEKPCLFLTLMSSFFEYGFHQAKCVHGM